MIVIRKVVVLIMQKVMKNMAIISVALTMVSIVGYNIINWQFSLSFTITFGTISYHFCMRLFIGTLYNFFMNNKVDYNKKWFKVCKWEPYIYNKLQVKKWKRKMPTYDKTLFDSNIHSWEKIIQAMCQSELVHETIIVFSFLPLVLSIWFGTFWVFFITSVLSACYDLFFL